MRSQQNWTNPQSPAPQDDPWATPATTSAGWGGGENEPPF